MLRAVERFVRIVDEKELYGVREANTQKVIVEPTYEWMSKFKKGFAIVKSNGKKGVINEDGEIVIPITYDYIHLT